MSNTSPHAKSALHGVMAEYQDEHQLIKAIEALKKAGAKKMEAYMPKPSEEVIEALGHRRTYIPLICLAGGLVGAATGYFIPYFCDVLAYPLNIGGRPLNDIPTFIPPTFELTILCAALFSVGAMLLLNGLPKLYHPVFNVDAFREATNDRYFLVVERAEPLGLSAARELLTGTKPLGVYDVAE